MDLNDVTGHIRQVAGDKNRILVGIAGPPASGKSTLTQQLNNILDRSAIVPMDGFHLSNDQLDKMGQRHRKGAPHTFDAEGFVALVGRLRDGEQDVKIPVFDRELDAVIDDGAHITSQDKIILVEGNYLLLDASPWDQLATLFDLTIFLSPSLAVIESRLIERWTTLGHSESDAAKKASTNDVPNAKCVLVDSIDADVMLS